MSIDRVNTYNEAVSYILEIPRFSAKNTTDDTRSFMGRLGKCDTKTVIHVAGTNGKGSCCAFLNSVYMKMGRKTGLFTSPHLVDIRERIQIDGEMISKEDFLKYTNLIIDSVNEFRDDDSSYHPSFFEFLFFMAFRYFEDRHIDVAIYETGLGGRLDATNSLPRKSICIITEIGMDHMEYLGDSLEQIAGEKAGILMKGVPAVYWSGRKECAEIIKNAADSMSAPCYGVSSENAKVLRTAEKSIDFSYKCGYDNDTIFTVNTYAQYQVYNAILAIRALDLLGIDISSEAVKQGIAQMRWPGRMEEIEKNIFLDGGHNVDGIEAFIQTVTADGCKGKRHLLFSAVTDKQVEIISRMLVECAAFDRISVCELNSQRAKKLTELKMIFEALAGTSAKAYELCVYGDVASAFDKERELIKDGDRLYICGSLYLVGAVKEYIEAKYL